MIETKLTRILGIQQPVISSGMMRISTAELVSGERDFQILENGDMEYGIWWPGISPGLIDDIPTVAELISRMGSEAETIINERLAGLSKQTLGKTS